MRENIWGLVRVQLKKDYKAVKILWGLTLLYWLVELGVMCGLSIWKPQTHYVMQQGRAMQLAMIVMIGLICMRSGRLWERSGVTMYPVTVRTMTFSRMIADHIILLETISLMGIIYLVNILVLRGISLVLPIYGTLSMDWNYLGHGMLLLLLYALVAYGIAYIVMTVFTMTRWGTIAGWILMGLCWLSFAMDQDLLRFGVLAEGVINAADWVSQQIGAPMIWLVVPAILALWGACLLLGVVLNNQRTALCQGAFAHCNIMILCWFGLVLGLVSISVVIGFIEESKHESFHYFNGEQYTVCQSYTMTIDEYTSEHLLSTDYVDYMIRGKKVKLATDNRIPIAALYPDTAKSNGYASEDIEYQPGQLKMILETPCYTKDSRLYHYYQKQIAEMDVHIIDGKLLIELPKTCAIINTMFGMGYYEEAYNLDYALQQDKQDEYFRGEVYYMLDSASYLGNYGIAVLGDESTLNQIGEEER